MRVAEVRGNIEPADRLPTAGFRADWEPFPCRRPPRNSAALQCFNVGRRRADEVVIESGVSVLERECEAILDVVSRLAWARTYVVGGDGGLADGSIAIQRPPAVGGQACVTYSINAREL